RDLVSQPLLVAVGVAPRNRAAACSMRVVPVLHVVLLGQPGRTRIADVIVAQEGFDLGWRCRVDEIPAPNLGLVRAARMPHRDRPGLARMQGGVREDLAGAAHDAAPFAEPTPPLGLTMREILRNGRGVPVCGRYRFALQQRVNAGLMP